MTYVVDLEQRNRWFNPGQAVYVNSTVLAITVVYDEKIKKKTNIYWQTVFLL